MTHRLAFAAMSACAALAMSAPAAVLAQPAAPSPQADPVLAQVVAGPQRAPDQAARDGARHPAETLTFWGLKPGMTVLELNPGGGYWTEILAPYAQRTGGHFIATAADLKDPAVSDYARKGRTDFEARFSDSAKFGKIVLADFGAKSGPLAPPGSVDLVITARNVHNWVILPGRLDKVLADSYAALKPGGLLGVEDHRADPRPMLPGSPDGYMDEATVIAAAQKAGFKLDARSEINANPKDTKDHPFGVWTLPPERRSAERGKEMDPKFDRAKYDAIGESDRMTLRFRKPG